MEDFDLFTDEINYTQSFYLETLNKFVYEGPAIGPNYQMGQKLLAEESLSSGKELECAFHFSEAVSASLRTMAVYRDEQTKAAEDKFYNITRFLKPVQELIDNNPISKDYQELLDFLRPPSDISDAMESLKIEDSEPLHRRYLRFSSENNTDNFQRILNELPEEWTVVQLTAPYNPSENFKPLTDYRTEIDALYVSVLTNDYLDGVGPFTVCIPANVTKEGEKPLFTELYSLLEDNYKTIDNAQFLNNTRLVQNYWDRREDVDLRMKSVLNVMDKEWLGGWSILLTGKLVDRSWRQKIIKLVDDTISDWGFIKLTKKQRVLLYNLIETCPNLNSAQIKSCIRQILTEHGDKQNIVEHLNTDCCSKEFELANELCLQCLSSSFEQFHHFSLVDGIRAFSGAAKTVREGDDWSALKKAKRQPVVLLVDEILDTFPWESLPVLRQHPVSRMENIHFLYNLFKLHETRIVDGYFSAKTDVGRYVINPEKNLDRMEKRMKSFVQYWCEPWSGHISEPPPPEDFLKHLNEADVFLYCGHGDGCRFAAGAGGGAGVEAARASAVAILAGCGSVRLSMPPGRGPPTAAHHQLHIAGCPMVVGMLWEVTDLEVDKVVSTLVSLFVPSSAALPWPAVGKAQWSQGVLDTTTEAKTPFKPEPNLLRAVSRARGSTNFVMIASSVVARGLPVRIKPTL